MSARTPPRWIDVRALLQNEEIRAVADRVLGLLAEFIGVPTLFVALNDQETNISLRAFNREGTERVTPLGQGTLPEAYCSVVVQAAHAVVVADTAEDARTAPLPVTRVLGRASFFGVPIRLGDGWVIGTLCALDPGRHQPSTRELALLEATAELLARVIDLELITARDPLTGAFTRRLLDELARSEVLRAEVAAFVFIDVDDLKRLNDEFGHAAGDAVLAELSRRMRAVVRAGDALFRFGGDEFVAVLARTASREAAEAAARRIVDACAAPVRLGRREVVTSVSAGVSFYPADAPDLPTLLAAADRRMYEAKRGGKGTYRAGTGDPNGGSTTI